VAPDPEEEDKLMAKKTAKRTPAKTKRTKPPKSLTSLLNKPGATLKILRIDRSCTTGESSGRFLIEGTFKKPK
jgi:hypothetical protein